MKKIFPIMNLIFPTILFYWIYRCWGIIAATIFSVLISGLSMAVQYYKVKKIANTAVIGLLGLMISSITIYFTGNEKFYYVPALTMNMITFIFLCILSIKKKSVLHYLAKDFEIVAIKQLPEKDLGLLNLIWLLFFGCKILTKMIGIVYLDFARLYWLVFLMGDPAMVCMIIISIIIIRIQFVHKNGL
ncbi:MAG: septation protein IspZ [Roseburia sp.]|nr:septation protein IspZ [Roseburia sp.]